MHYALDLRTFIFSHYFYTGLRIGTGIVGFTLLVLPFTDLPTAMTVCIGALSTSLMDLPSTLRHKFNEMLSSVLLCSIVTLIISLCAPFQWLLSIMLVLVTFLACMMVVYGKKAMPLQFAALFAMTLSMSNTVSIAGAFLHTGVFFGGGMAYLGYSMVVSWFLRRRIKQQILAEALFELARYLDIKADFYDMHVELNNQFNRLVRQQIVLADKQQASRDLILRGPKSQQNAILVQVHFGMFDLYEYILSTHTDYMELRQNFADADILTYFRDLINKAAKDIETIAYAITRKRASFRTISYKAEFRAIEVELQQLQQDSLAGKIPEAAMDLIRVTYNKIRDTVDMIDELHRATQGAHGELPDMLGADMTPFLTQQKYQLGVLLANLRWQSPAFRFALRGAMAITVGLLVAEHLPYTSHGYWIVLTIAIILKPSFSQTKQRRSDRLLGTLIGCVATALILRFVHEPVALLGFLFLATVAAPAFIYVKYRYTAIAASMQILLQINLVIPSSGHVIGERLLDTIIGAAIATAFSFVLPSWEYRTLPQLVRRVLTSNMGYLEAANNMLQAKTPDDFIYRLSRKRFLDSIADLVSTLVRMLDEPASKHRAVEELNQFIVQNYLVMAHVAAMRLLLRRNQESLPRPAVNALLQQATTHVCLSLTLAEQVLNPKSDPLTDTNELSVEPVDITAETTLWKGWWPLQRRVELLYQDADKISLRSADIGRILG
ncbi:FUSC family membrane protein [Glaciimonas sp. Gout2]|uniref:FUSC family membrane protein n=1 Tax=unclassified Glaciimonas TaxID=2644401 RepID=UPI002B233953|nr:MULTISPECIES: FUSC family membrane protein [unclassified Glaciimonas]MEB0011089.1 FUSC family membrane protein [Glaciimonas sp. Cout2]MEB0081233.1 FUSC family membrane protein [Glaciimonas sp. Gout2]